MLLTGDTRFFPSLMQCGNTISSRRILQVSIVTNEKARGTIGFVMSYGRILRHDVADHYAGHKAVSV